MNRFATLLLVPVLTLLFAPRGSAADLSILDHAGHVAHLR